MTVSGEDASSHVMYEYTMTYEFGQGYGLLV